MKVAWLVIALSAVSVPVAAMDLIDFKTDKAKLIGQKVELEGFLMPFTEGVALLTTAPGDMHPVMVDFTAAPRDQRRQLHACTSTCKGKVSGTVGIVSVQQIGVVANSLSVVP